jgi:hypothetical protein
MNGVPQFGAAAGYGALTIVSTMAWVWDISNAPGSPSLYGYSP